MKRICTVAGKAKGPRQALGSDNDRTNKRLRDVRTRFHRSRVTDSRQTAVGFTRYTGHKDEGESAGDRIHCTARSYIVPQVLPERFPLPLTRVGWSNWVSVEPRMTSAGRFRCRGGRSSVMSEHVPRGAGVVGCVRRDRHVPRPTLRRAHTSPTPLGCGARVEHNVVTATT